MRFDLCNKNLTTLEYIDFPDDITELDCSGNQLTSLEHAGLCPASAPGACPPNLQILYCNCNFNQLTSLEHCPQSLQVLYCNANQLTSLEHCPQSLQKLYYWGNPLSQDWNKIFGMSLQEKLDFIYLKQVQKGLNKVNSVIRNWAAFEIQQAFENYYYRPNNEGETLYIQRQIEGGYLPLEN